MDESTSHAHNESTTAGTTEPDNKLLSFGAPILKHPILDLTGQIWPAMNAELYGMFFVAEDVFGDTNPAVGRPMELTCYRRNLFQISGTIVLSRSIKAIISEQGHQIPLYDLTASITAKESIEGKNTEIIAVPWKTSSASSSEEKAGTAPAKIPLDLSANPELDPTMVSIPVAWKRLQFKHATANNGRRKGLQQHYVIQISLAASLATGENVNLAIIESGAIIVRGRSPRNFDSKKDIPLSEKKPGGEKPKMMVDTSMNIPQVKPDPGTNNFRSYYYSSSVVVCISRLFVLTHYIYYQRSNHPTLQNGQRLPQLSMHLQPPVHHPQKSFLDKQKNQPSHVSLHQAQTQVLVQADHLSQKRNGNRKRALRHRSI